MKYRTQLNILAKAEDPKHKKSHRRQIHTTNLLSVFKYVIHLVRVQFYLKTHTISIYLNLYESYYQFFT